MSNVSTSVFFSHCLHCDSVQMMPTSGSCPWIMLMKSPLSRPRMLPLPNFSSWTPCPRQTRVRSEPASSANWWLISVAWRLMSWDLLLLRWWTCPSLWQCKLWSSVVPQSAPVPFWRFSGPLTKLLWRLMRLSTPWHCCLLPPASWWRTCWQWLNTRKANPSCMLWAMWSGSK